MKRPIDEASRKPFHADITDAVDFLRGPIQHVHAAVAQDALYFFGRSRLMIVVTENGEHRSAPYDGERLREDLGFDRLALIGQIPTEQNGVRFGSQMAE